MIHITGVAHIGIRVADFERSVRFYTALDFSVIRDDRKERVVVLKHPSGVEINLLDSADHDNEGRNVLMDEAIQFPGYTHIALGICDVYAAAQEVRLMDIAITEGPVTFGDGSTSIFFRDPDRNVIELSQPDPEYVPQIPVHTQAWQGGGR
jgi:lactoylglutathione lyase